MTIRSINILPELSQNLAKILHFHGFLIPNTVSKCYYLLRQIGNHLLYLVHACDVSCNTLDVCASDLEETFDAFNTLQKLVNSVLNKSSIFEQNLLVKLPAPCFFVKFFNLLPSFVVL